MSTIPNHFKTKSGLRILPGSYWQQIKTIQKGINPDKASDLWVENDAIKLLRDCGAIFVNDKFIELWNKTSGLLFLDGGYGSSKTTYVITRQLVKCKENKYFRCYYGRQKKTEARNLHLNIITEIRRNGWEKEFDFSDAPNGSTRIKHKITGNFFEMFGCDNDDSLKGIDNPTDIIVDEINQISFSSFGMLYTRLRTPGVELQFIGMFNNCDVFDGNWLKDYIYGESKGTELTEQDLGLLKELEKANIYRHHSTYLDNKFVNPYAYYSKLVIKAGNDPVKINAYANGDWGVRLGAQPYYKMFNKNKHVDARVAYDYTKPLFLSWDENLNPYLPVLLLQPGDGMELLVVDEIAAVSPNNRLEWVCDEIKRRYPNHSAGMRIFGDATSKKESVRDEKGKNMFTFLMEYLDEYLPSLHVEDSNPNNAVRGIFVNLILSTEYEGIKIRISPKCINLITDLVNCEEKPDGTGKLKKLEMVNGVKGVQRYGHFGDCLDYVVCKHFQVQYILFQNRKRTYNVKGGNRVVKNTPEYRPEHLVKRVVEEEIDERERRHRQLINYKRTSKNGIA